jgi:hypothetical protein
LATTGRGDHEVHKEHVMALKKIPDDDLHWSKHVQILLKDITTPIGMVTMPLSM